MQAVRTPRIDSLVVLFLLAIMAMMFDAVSTTAQESKNPKQQQKLENAAKSDPATQKPEAKPAPAKKESPYTYARFWPQWLQMGLTYRGRIEKPSGRSFANDQGDGYYLSRFRLEMTVRPSNYVDFFAMAQDSRVYQYNDLSKRPSGMTDAMDLRQAYVDIHAKKEARSFALRIGRQYIDLGSKRLIAVSSWSNSPPTYDAARFTYVQPGLTTDFFAATRLSTIYAYKFNEPKKGENLYGAYLSFDKLVPKAKIEPYLLWRTQPLVTDELKNKGDSDLVTVGLRFFGKLPARLDYTSELAFQRGTYANDSVSAWAGTWGLGYVIKPSRFNPRIGIEYNYASGDQAKGDGVHGTFDQLYASNHSLYGIADQIGWRNANNYKIGFEIDATKRLKVQFDLNDFYIATVADALYSDNGSSVLTNAKATSRHIGYEPDLQITYKLNKQVSLGTGYARVIPGRFLKESTAGYSFNYPYLFLEFKY